MTVDRVELRRIDERRQLRALAESHSVDRADCQFPRHTTVLALGVLELLNQLDALEKLVGDESAVPDEWAGCDRAEAIRQADWKHGLLMDLYAQFERMRDERDVLADQLNTVGSLLHEFVDAETGSCRFDHHGYCQEHHGGFADGGCATRRAYEFLAAEQKEPT